MTEIVKKNVWAIAIGIITLVSSYAVYGHRIENLEKRADSTNLAIESLNRAALQDQITLAEIKKDIEYIRLQVSRIVP